MRNIDIKNKEISEEMANRLFEKANDEGRWEMGDGYRAGQKEVYEEVRDGLHVHLEDVFYTEFYCLFETDIGIVRITAAFDDDAMEVYDPENHGDDYSILDWDNPTVIEARIVG